jgi:hypothetical protein
MTPVLRSGPCGRARRREIKSQRESRSSEPRTYRASLARGCGSSERKTPRGLEYSTVGPPLCRARRGPTCVAFAASGGSAWLPRHGHHRRLPGLTQGDARPQDQDLPAAETAVLAVTQGPIVAPCFDDKLSGAAWASEPSSYNATTRDRRSPPTFSTRWPRRMGARYSCQANRFAITGWSAYRRD